MEVPSACVWGVDRQPRALAAAGTRGWPFAGSPTAAMAAAMAASMLDALVLEALQQLLDGRLEGGGSQQGSAERDLRQLRKDLAQLRELLL